MNNVTVCICKYAIYIFITHMILPKDGGNGYDDGQYVQHDECCSLLGHCDEHSKLHRRRGAPAVCRFVWCRGWVPRSDLEIWSLANLFKRLSYWKTAHDSTRFIHFQDSLSCFKTYIGGVFLCYCQVESFQYKYKAIVLHTEFHQVERFWMCFCRVRLPLKRTWNPKKCWFVAVDPRPRALLLVWLHVCFRVV